MRILGNLIIALLGGVIAVFIYSAIDNNDRPPEDGDRINPFKRNTSFTSSSADSINNVFNVGFGDAAESTLAKVVHTRARVITPAPQDPFLDFFGDGFGAVNTKTGVTVLRDCSSWLGAANQAMNLTW